MNRSSRIAATIVAAGLSVAAVGFPVTMAGGDVLGNAGELTTTTTIATTSDDGLSPLVDGGVEMVDDLVGATTEVAEETTQPVVEEAVGGGGGDGNTNPPPPVKESQPTEGEPTKQNAPAAGAGAGDISATASGAPAGSSAPATTTGGAGQRSVGAADARVSLVPAVPVAAVVANGTKRASAPAPESLPLADADFATGSRKPSIAPLLVGGQRSSVPILDLLSGRGLTPQLLAALMAPFPLAGPARYSGARGATTADIGVAQRTPVIASADGIVNRVDSSSLRLTGEDGTIYAYGGLSQLAPRVSDGDRVAKGAVVGFVDDSLQFALRPGGGSAVDPVPYLDRWLGEALQRAQSLLASPGSAAALLRLRPAQGADAAPAGSEAPNATEVLSLDGAQRIVATSGLPLLGIAGLLLSAWGRGRWWRRMARPQTAS